MELVVKNPSANAGDIRDVSLIPELARSPGGGNGNLLQGFCLENHMDSMDNIQGAQGRLQMNENVIMYIGRKGK